MVDDPRNPDDGAAGEDGRDLAALTGRASMPDSIRKGGGMQKLDWVMSRPDPGSYIGSLATGEFYMLVREIGVGDAYSLLELASDEQLQGIQAIDIWSGEEMRSDRWLAWLDRARAASLETAMRFVRATEPEVLQLFFLGEIQVHDKDLDVDMLRDDVASIQSPDFMFWITVAADAPIAEALPGLLKLLWAADMDRMREIFLSCRYELPAQVHETLLRFRRGRLSDMGFTAQDEALGVYTTLNTQRARDEARACVREEMVGARSRDGEVAQEIALHGITAPHMLGEAVAGLSDEERGVFAEALTVLVNKIFMAQTGDLTHTEHLPAAARHTCGLVNLGLSYLADESPQQATRVLVHFWPERLFRVGYSLTFDLARRARRIRARAGVRLGLSLFGTPTDEALDGVAAARPAYFEGLDDRAQVTWRDFSTLAQLSRIEVLVADADEVLAFFETHLGFSPEVWMKASLGGVSGEERRHIRLQTLFRTGLVQAMLTDAFAFAPLEEDDLAAFLQGAFERDGETITRSPALTALVEGMAPHTTPTLRAWIDDAVDELALALGRVQASDLDPRYARSLVLVSD